MKYFAATLLLLVSLSTPQHATADYLSPIVGASYQEQQIRWLWLHLETFVSSCLDSTADCQEPGLRARFVALKQSLKSQKSKLEFVSEAQHPELFRASAVEAHRLAVTALEAGATVYINTDRMQQPLETWVALLVHECVHHLGVEDGEARVPDQIGLAIAKHFVTQAQVSSLEQYYLPNTQSVTFNSSSPGQAAIGYLANGTRMSDLTWGQTPTQHLCAPGDTLQNQFVSAPAWRLNRMRIERGLVTFRGNSYAKMTCKTQSGQLSTNTQPITALITLQYPAPLDLEHWPEQTPTPTFDEDEYAITHDDVDRLWSFYQTFVVLSTTHEKAELNAGELWKTRLVLRATDGFKPTTCTLFVAGTQYAYVTRDRLVGINNFDSCVLTALGDNQWQVDGEVRIPANARSDNYFIPTIFFNTPQEQRAAVPLYPTYLRVHAQQELAKPIIRGIRVLGLEAASRLGTLPLTNSYQIEPGQSFKVQFTVEGPQTASEPWLDVDLWTPLATEFGILHGTGSSDSWPDILTDTLITPVAGGTQITFTFKMPWSISGMQIAAIKFRRFYLRTSDYSWVEVEMPGLHDAMVVNPVFGF